MAATIGANDLDLSASPRPDLLRAISGIDPVANGTHVLLEPYGVQSSDAGRKAILTGWGRTRGSTCAGRFGRG